MGSTGILKKKKIKALGYEPDVKKKHKSLGWDRQVKHTLSKGACWYIQFNLVLYIPTYLQILSLKEYKPKKINWKITWTEKENFVHNTIHSLQLCIQYVDCPLKLCKTLASHHPNEGKKHSQLPNGFFRIGKMCKCYNTNM